MEIQLHHDVFFFSQMKCKANIKFTVQCKHYAKLCWCFQTCHVCWKKLSQFFSVNAQFNIETCICFYDNVHNCRFIKCASTMNYFYCRIEWSCSYLFGYFAKDHIRSGAVLTFYNELVSLEKENLSVKDCIVQRIIDRWLY